MHDCPDCGQVCDCDGEDHYQSPPRNCTHDCDNHDDLEDDGWLDADDTSEDELDW